MSRTQLCFHLPLHRYLAAFISQLGTLYAATDNSRVPLSFVADLLVALTPACACGAPASLSPRGGVGDARELFIRKLVMHPLTIQVWCMIGHSLHDVRAEYARRNRL